MVQTPIKHNDYKLWNWNLREYIYKVLSKQLKQQLLKSGKTYYHLSLVKKKFFERDDNVKFKKQVTEKSFTDRVLWSITEHFEDLRHFPSGPQVHPETRHGTPCGQADYTAAAREE